MAGAGVVRRERGRRLGVELPCCRQRLCASGRAEAEDHSMSLDTGHFAYLLLPGTDAPVE
jgi:hypothetical protein